MAVRNRRSPADGRHLQRRDLRRTAIPHPLAARRHQHGQQGRTHSRNGSQGEGAQAGTLAEAPRNHALRRFPPHGHHLRPDKCRARPSDVLVDHLKERTDTAPRLRTEHGWMAGVHRAGRTRHGTDLEVRRDAELQRRRGSAGQGAGWKSVDLQPAHGQGHATLHPAG